VAGALSRPCPWEEEWLGEIDRAEPSWQLLWRTLGAVPDALACRAVHRDLTTPSREAVGVGLRAAEFEQFRRTLTSFSDMAAGQVQSAGCDVWQ
jgi:hypothetical protein